MACASGSSYYIKANDQLRFLAEKFLGDETRWREIRKPDGSIFTEEEAGSLQVGQEVCLPIQAPAKGDFQDFLNALGERESNNQYDRINDFGFMGRFQFGEALLYELSYYQPPIVDGKPLFYQGDPNQPPYKNLWQGSWTGKRQLNSQADFLRSPEVQNFAILEAFNLNWNRIVETLDKQTSPIDTYLNQKKTFIDGDETRTVTITTSGILAGAHLSGAYGLANVLLQPNNVPADEFGTSILDYMDQFGGYNVNLNDFLNPA